MARFIPDVPSADIGHDSERLVYEALRGLPEGFVVLHSFPWLRPMRDLADEPLREGEADFVILHPERGLLVLEVKGGQPELVGRHWHRGGKELRDPFDQARRSRYALLEAIEERTRQRIHRGLFAHGDVVVFPHARFTGVLPVNGDPRVVVDGLDLPTLPARIEEAYRAWARSETRLDPDAFAALLDALMPKLRLLRCASAEVNAEHQRIVQVTRDQQTILRGLLGNQRALVEGTAGSGKTLLALDFAMTLAQEGQRVLLLCYNRQLAAWLMEQAKQDLRPRGDGTPLEIVTFHACARRLAQRAGLPFEVPNRNVETLERQTAEEAVEDFWERKVPRIMGQALEILRERGQPELFDALFVDEAQDFSSHWWEPIESLTRGGQDGRLYVFLDLKQSMRRVAELPPVPFGTHLHLTHNCRNTKAIALSGAALANVKAEPLSSLPTGEVPAVRRATSPAVEAGLVLAEVGQLLQAGITPQQIALIGPVTHAKGALARHTEVDGVPLIDDAVDWRRGGGVLVTTARAFKGLEADVVVAYGLGAYSETFTTADLYVAWTRARHRLILVCHTGEVRAQVEAALPAAERTQTLPKSTAG